MCSVSLAAFSRHSPATCFAELVRKIETSATQSIRKRKSRARKKVLRAVTEQRRYAKEAQLRAVAVTLTFANDASFSSRLVGDFLARVRQTLKRRGYALPYTWVLERGSRLHYHLMVWLPRDFVANKDMLEKWWPWGATHIESCRSVKAWGRYIAKFECIAVIPKGARLFGFGGLDASGKAAVHRVALPQWLQTLLPTGDRARRFTGGGWINAETGEFYRSPYRWTPRGCFLRDVYAEGAKHLFASRLCGSSRFDH
jgi:hypothetical protein